MNLGLYLKSYRRIHHLCQKEVAAELGISREYYSKLENDATLPSTAILGRIACLTSTSIQISSRGKCVVPNKVGSESTCAMCSQLMCDDLAVVSQIIHRLMKAK